MRIEAVKKLLDPSLDFGLLTKKENIFYLTGYFPTSFAILVFGEETYLAISEMDSELTKDLDLDVRIIKNFKKELKFEGSIGVEKKYTTLSFADQFLGKCEVEDLKIIDEMRMIKDKGEINLIKKAIDLTEKVLLGVDLQDSTEKSVAMDIIQKVNGEANLAFDPIVATGPNSAIPHHTPKAIRIDPQDSTIVDLGARVGHYNSDMSRTFSESKQKRFSNVYNAVKDAQKAGIRKVRPGKSASDCDKTIRSVLKERGLENYFVHSSGHGVGLEVHEAPKISLESTDIFKKSMVLSIEPGVYIPGWGGVRIEDMVLVGNPTKVLTSYPS